MNQAPSKIFPTNDQVSEELAIQKLYESEFKKELVHYIKVYIILLAVVANSLWLVIIVGGLINSWQWDKQLSYGIPIFTIDVLWALYYQLAKKFKIIANITGVFFVICNIVGELCVFVQLSGRILDSPGFFLLVMNQFCAQYLIASPNQMFIIISYPAAVSIYFFISEDIQDAETFYYVIYLGITGLVQILFSRFAKQDQIEKIRNLYSHQKGSHRGYNFITRMTDGVMVLNQDHQIILLNDAFYEVFKLEKSEASFKTLLDLDFLFQDWNNDTKAYNLQQILTSVSVSDEIAHFRASKGDQMIHVQINSLFINESDCLTIVFQDISKWKELEDSKRLSQLRSSMLFATSHEFRNPVQGIISMLNIIEPSLDEVNQYYLSIAKSSADLVLFLANDMLDYAQIESGTLNLVFESFKPYEAVTQIVRLLKFKSQQKSLPVKIINKFQNKNLEIVNDQNRFKQIVMNLLSNSIKFTNQGQISIILSDKKDTGQRLFQISIQDTGIGIPEEKLSNLFCMYNKLEDSQLNPTGVGLGLTITKALSEQMGGSISVSSQIGIGSTFTVCFQHQSMSSKLLSCPESSELQRSEEILTPKAHVISPFDLEEQTNLMDRSSFILLQPNNKRVLFVDDDPLIIFIYKSMTSCLDVQTFFATSGAEGLQILIQSYEDENPIGVIFTDLKMPQMNGDEFIKKALASGLVHSSFYILSALITNNIIEEMVSIGATDALNKPLAIRTIKQILKLN